MSLDVAARFRPQRRLIVADTEHCHCGQPLVARCSWRMHIIVEAPDPALAQIIDDDGNMYMRLFSGETCGLHLCAEHINRVEPNATLCLWHFLRGKEQGVVPVDAIAGPAWRERLAKEALELLLVRGAA